MTSSTPTRSSTPIRLIALGVVATLVLFLTGALFAGNANAETDEKKVFVCKYVGTPGDDERLQTGDNPISVSVNAVDSPDVGSVFNDKQGRSYVIAVDDGGDEPEPVCPATPPGGNGDENGDENGTTPDTKTPVSAPTDLGSSTTTGLVSLFAIAASLLGAAAFLLRGARN